MFPRSRRYLKHCGIIISVFVLGIFIRNLVPSTEQLYGTFTKPPSRPLITRHLPTTTARTISCPMRHVSIMKKTDDFSPIGFLSFPGSGNTWMRYMIQQFTGYCTGTVYCNGLLNATGFPGECVFPDHKTKACLFYKSHSNVTRELEQFEKAIILVRNPYDSIRAFFNWHYGNISKTKGNDHKAEVDRSTYNSSKWNSWVKDNLIGWKTSYLVWQRMFANRSLVVRYEDLKENLIPTLVSIGKYLNVTSTARDYLCAVVNKEGKHHRVYKKPIRTPDIFSRDQIKMINSVIKGVTKTTQNVYRSKDYIFK